MNPMEVNISSFQQFSKSIDPHWFMLRNAVEFMQGKRTVFVTTSNRWPGSKETPKSSQLAEIIAQHVFPNPVIIHAADLVIFPCEGNISTSPENGANHCGVPGAVLKDEEKNPGSFLRCWASINNPTDELWRVSKALYESDGIVFFGSMRWGSMNSIYKKLIERLTWIENRSSTLKGINPVKGKFAGLMMTGQNWNGSNELEMQKQVLDFFGFETPDELFWNWQYTQNAKDETQSSYVDAYFSFEEHLEKLNLFL